MFIIPDDLKEVQSILADISAAEPVAVISMIGNGKGTLYRYLSNAKLLQGMPYKVVFLNATKEDQLDPFLDSLRGIQEPTLVIIHLAIGKDVSWFVNELEMIRKERLQNFVTVVFSNICEVSDALALKRKLLSGSLYIIKPASDLSGKYILDELQNKFSFNIDKAKAEDIIRLSGGHRGLIKAIFLAFKNNPKLNIDMPTMLDQDSVVFRLQEIAEELGEEKLRQLFFSNSASDFFEKYGYLNAGKVFTPLLEEYVKIYTPSVLEKPAADEVLVFTPQERAAFNLLKENANHVVEREDVARVVWEEDWEEKYSDWAIDMLIHRIRSKLKNITPKLQLQTKKGVGFILLSED